MKISVITVNYNNAEGLKRTIESIAPHITSELEYIVIDGASTDNSIEIIKQHADKISYWISEPDKGVFCAMNKGLEKASGEYVLYINSGDLINNNADFKKLQSFLEREDLVYFDIEMQTGENSNSFINTYPDKLDFKFFAEQSLPHQATFIKRKTLIEYGGYNEQMRLGADWAFTINAVCLKQYSYKHVALHFSTYYLNGISSQSENFGLLWQEKESHIRTYYPLYYSLYREWMEKKDELYKLKYSVSVRYLKKIGFLKWLKL
ncbi:MAG: glycosyltransferase [Prevotella sp.]|jgi:glycosyltransferase involved in cell wall biosynthesis|nr:glycosyltransferase [Prevotella sp.]